MLVKTIKDLIHFTLTDKENKHAECVFSHLSAKQAAFLEKHIGLNLKALKELSIQAV